MGFQIASEHYKAEAKNHVRNFLLNNPSSEYDDFTRRFRGARHIGRFIFKEVKADLQLEGKIPMALVDGEKAYDIVKRQVEKDLKAEQQEVAAALEIKEEAPALEPVIMAPANTPENGATSPSDFTDYTPAPTEEGPDISPVTGRRYFKGGTLTNVQKLQIELLIQEMPDLMPAEIVETLKIPGLTAGNVGMMKNRVLQAIGYQPPEGANEMTRKSDDPKRQTQIDKVRENLLKLSKADVLALNASGYEKRFHHTLQDGNVFRSAQYGLKRQWESGAGPAAFRPAAATLSESHKPTPPVLAGLARSTDPSTPALMTGVVIATIGTEKFAETETKVLKNLIPIVVREALRKFGVTPPELTAVITENDQDERILEVRVK